eukprot:5261477-Amphidinium_carterae.1
MMQDGEPSSVALKAVASPGREWWRTVHMQLLLALVPCILLPWYTSVRVFSCTVVWQQLRFPIVAADVHAMRFLVVAMSSWMWSCMIASGSHMKPVSRPRWAVKQIGTTLST